VISIFLLLIVVKWGKKWSYLIQFILFITTTIYCYYIINYEGYKTISNYLEFYSENAEKYYMKIYVKPWSRTGPYFLGLSLGIYYYFFN
jgi:hypothetical protein